MLAIQRLLIFMYLNENCIIAIIHGKGWSNRSLLRMLGKIEWAADPTEKGRFHRAAGKILLRLERVY